MKKEKEIDFDGVQQPPLSPRMLEKIADTFSRKLGRPCSATDAQAWWDWIWPDFEGYWRAKRYRNIGRAITGWASRVREHELDRALEAAASSENAELQLKQQKLNEEAETVAASVVPIDYFKVLGKG